jgi:hypothetical protein
MTKNATQLGAEFGLNAAEMNFVLREEGFLDGEPGAYRVTEKGEPFATEHDHHRGPGGNSSLTYNRHWTTRRWHESVTDGLEIDVNRRQELREAITAAKVLLATEAVDVDVDKPTDGATGPSGLSDAQKALVIAVGVVLVTVSAYGVYRLAPTIKRLWEEKAAPSLAAARERIRGLWPSEVEIP